MTPVSHGKPCAGNPHARFEEGASAQAEPRRSALLHNMRFAVAMSFCVLFGLVAEGHPQSAKIVGDTLVWWPRDFRGVAVVPPNVRHIDNGAFAVCKSLTGVVFPQSIESIGQVAFMGCESLRDVQLPSSVTNIGGAAFDHCVSLTSLVVRARVERIPGGLCDGCCALRSVELPDGVSEVEGAAFRGCRSIRSILLPASVSRIGPSAFAGCSRMNRLQLPKKLLSIGTSAFSRCYDMKYLVVHPLLREVGVDAFQDCFSLKGVVVVDSPPVLDRGTLVEEVRECTVLVVPNAREAFDSSCREEWMRDCVVDSCESVEEAGAVFCAMKGTQPREDVFAGLEQALRLAADGLIAGLPANHANVKILDYYIGELHKLMGEEDVGAIKQYFFEHSQFASDVGVKITAIFDVLNDISIAAEFKDGKLSKLVPSEGLKNAIRVGMKIENVKTDESVLRWLR